MNLPPLPNEAVTPEYLEWLKSIWPRNGLGGNVAWNAGYEAGRQAQREAVAAAVPGWQPIETAPKNCRILIGRVGHPWAVSARWNERKEYWSTGQTPMDFFAEPTHWMPLPPPPKAES